MLLSPPEAAATIAEQAASSYVSEQRPVLSSGSATSPIPSVSLVSDLSEESREKKAEVLCSAVPDDSFPDKSKSLVQREQQAYSDLRP